MASEHCSVETEKGEAGIRGREWGCRQVDKLDVVSACCLAGSEGQE